MGGETACGHAKAIARKLGLATSARAAIVTVAQELDLLGESLALPRPRRGVYDYPHRAEKSTGGGC